MPVGTMDLVHFHRVFFITRPVMNLPSGGPNGRSTAQRHYLPRGEFPVAAENLSHRIDGQLAHSFPNPVPAGTYVPAWALLDVTVRCYYGLLFSYTYSQYNLAREFLERQQIDGHRW